MTDHNTDLTGLQGGNSTERYHTTAAEWTALTANQPFGAGRVLFADSDGHINHESALAWDAANDRLGIGAGSPAVNLHVSGASGTVTIKADAGDGAAIIDLDGGGVSGESRVQFRDDNTGIFRLRYVHAEGYAALYDDINNYDVAQFPTDNHGQVLLRAGAAAWPTIARQGYPHDGLFWPGDGLFAVALGDTERFRWSGNNVGMMSGGRIYLDGVACSGNTSIRERTSDVIALAAGGYDQFEVRSDHQYARPTTYTPGSDGVFGFRTTDNALEHRVGSVVHRNGLCVYSGSPESDNTWSGSERTLDSFTIPAAYWKVGKRIQVRATVLVVQGSGEEVGGSVTIRVYIGATEAMETSVGRSAQQGWVGAHIDFEMDLIVGAVQASGYTVYPTRTMRLFKSTVGAEFGSAQDVTEHKMYPMKAAGDPPKFALQIDTTAAQAVSVKYQCSGQGAGTVMLYGLTIYST